MPTPTVLDNRTARLQIGEQVPVVTQQATSTESSSNGHVLLNIEQEVSDVVRTTSSGIDSPSSASA